MEEGTRNKRPATNGGWLLVALLVPLALIAATACGGDDNTAPASGGSPTVAATTPAGKTATPAGPTGTPSTTEAGMTLEEFVIKPNVTRARPGTVIFKVKNDGKVAHQFVVVKSDLPTAELPRRDDGQGVDESKINIVGRLDSVAPGEEKQLTVPADLGQYVLICNMFAGGVSHYLSGMYNQFTVENFSQLPPGVTGQ